MSKNPRHGLIPIALPPHWSISPRMQLVICLAIGHLSGYVPSVQAWDLGSWVTDSINGVHRSLTGGGGGGSNEPLPVPQGQPPIGNSATIHPCAAPPTTAVASPIAAPSIQKIQEPEDRTIWVASKLRYPQSWRAVERRFGTPDQSNWNTPRSSIVYTSETGKTITFELESSYDKPDIVIGYSVR